MSPLLARTGSSNSVGGGLGCLNPDGFAPGVLGTPLASACLVLQALLHSAVHMAGLLHPSHIDEHAASVFCVAAVTECESVQSSPEELESVVGGISFSRPIQCVCISW